MGHTSESYAEPLFRLHLLGGIESAAGLASGCPPARYPSRANRRISLDHFVGATGKHVWDRQAEGFCGL
jgi:hypothetical protein